LLVGSATATSKPLPVHASVPTPGIVNTFAGGSTTGFAASIQVMPWGLARSGSTLFIADYLGYVYTLNTSTGVESVYAGNGQPGTSGDLGQATAAAMGYPYGIALDVSGDLFIATNDRVRMVTPGGIISTVAGGGAGCTDPCSATAAALSSPRGISVDGSGALFVADWGHNTIRKVVGGTISTVAGTGTAGFSGDTGDAGAAELNHPQSVYVDGNGDLWIADTENHRVREVDHATGKIDTVAGNSSGGNNPCDNGPATSISLFFPSGITPDGSGNILIADQYDGCIRKLSGTTLTTVASNPGTNSLQLPANAVPDGAGGYYISDIYGPGKLMHGSGTTLQTISGDGTKCDVYGIGGQATSARLCRPWDVLLDGAGDLYIADIQGEVVLKVNPSGVLSTVAGTGQAGFLGDGGPATSAQLNGPNALALDASGNLYIGDNNTVRKVDHVTGNISTVAGTLGSYGFSGDGGPATSATLFAPSQIAFDAAGDLLIADTGNYRVRKVTPGGIISTIAGHGNCCNTGYSGPATSAYLNAPTGVAADAAGNIFIAQIGPTVKVDTSGDISAYSTISATRLTIGPGDRLVATAGVQAALLPASGASVVLAGSTAGGTTFSGDGGPALAAKFDYLAGLAVDATGDIYVADYFNRRVRRVQAYVAPSAPTGVSATAGRNSASVNWTAPSDSGGLPFVNYVVTPYTGITPHAPVTVSGSPPATAEIHQLVNGSAYTFTVQASNGWQAGAESAHSGSITPSVTPPGHITTIAGSAGVGEAHTIGQMPYAVAAGLGTSGDMRVFIGDLINPVVRQMTLAVPDFASTHQETVLAGNDGFGYAGDGGPPTSALMQGATAIADCGGNVYFADNLNYVIREVDYTGKLTTVAGTGHKGFSGDGGPGTQAQLSRVLGLACRTGGGIYISDSDNGRVRILDGAGTIRTWWTGFSFPTGIVELPYGNDDIAVSDAGSDNAVLELTDTIAYLIAGTPGHAGSSGDGGLSYLAKLNDPRGLAWTGSIGGFWLYVVDSGNNRIRLIDSTSSLISAFAGNGARGYVDASDAKDAEFDRPTGIALGPDGSKLFVADTNNLLVRTLATSGGPVSTIAGNRTMSLSGDGGPAIAAQLGIPYAVTFDSSGNEYIADNQNNVIRKIDVNGVITTFAGNGTAGYSGDGGPATSARLNDPRGVAVDSLGNLYISDAANQRIRKVAPSGTITTFAGTGIAGSSGDGSSAVSARIRYPEALAIDSTDNLYIADTGNNRVRKVSGGTITAFAGTGVAGFSSDLVPASAAKLNEPRGLAVNAAGDILIADAGNNRVRVVDHVTRNIRTLAGTGAVGFGGDGHPASGAELDFPAGVAVDGQGNIYISDSLNQRIRVVDVGGNISTVVGKCGVRAGFAGDGGVASTAAINYGGGIAVDSAGDLYIADLDNNRVRGAFGVVGGSRAACPAPIAGPPGARDTSQSPIASAFRTAGPSIALARMAQAPAGRSDWAPGHLALVTAGTAAKAQPKQRLPREAVPVKHGLPDRTGSTAGPAQIGIPLNTSKSSATAVGGATELVSQSAIGFALLLAGALAALLIAQRRRRRRS
jgi:DNA-binding beta-propeller fold protein YncE